MSRIVDSGAIAFHVLGDSGGVMDPRPQHAVADSMVADTKDGMEASFLYHLGDIAYFFGEGTNYYSQFYEPYSYYPAPIFAIPGNHDGEVTGRALVSPSLSAFAANFCDTSPRISPDAGDVSRDTMTQPNVFWTLESPFVTIVGLYSNVPEGGRFSQEQIGWLVGELREVRPGGLIVAAHHPAFSLDATHSGSSYVNDVLDDAFRRAGRVPDLILAGHVHNYQRFTRTMGPGTRQVPYIVAGGGGFWHLQSMQITPDGSRIATPFKIPGEDLVLESYCDDQYGYLRMEVTETKITCKYFSVPPPPTVQSTPRVKDAFELDLVRHEVRTEATPER